MHVTITRGDFEQAILPLIDEIELEIQNVLMCWLRQKLQQIHFFAIEFYGGNSRIRGIKDRLRKIFTNPKPSTTVNADECFAFGAGYSFLPNHAVDPFCEQPTHTEIPEEMIAECRKREEDMSARDESHKECDAAIIGAMREGLDGDSAMKELSDAVPGLNESRDFGEWTDFQPRLIDVLQPLAPTHWKPEAGCCGRS